MWTSRRAHIALPAIFLTIAALVVLMAGSNPSPSRSATNDGDPYHAPTAVDTNPQPKIFETTITAEPATVDIGNGVKAHALTYNGTVPGPTFRLNVGDTVIVHFHNHLDEKTGIHWHGIEVPNAMDGTPLTQNQVEPGGSFRYEFKVTRPGIFWYHPHHHSSTNQVFKGMYGMIVVRDPDESLGPAAGLFPPPDRTLRLALSDMTVCKAPGSNDAVTYDPSLPHASNGPLPAQSPPTPKDLCETSPVDESGNPRGPFAAGDIPNIQHPNAVTSPSNEGQTVLTNGVNVGSIAGSPEFPGQVSSGAKEFPVVAGQQVRMQLLNASTKRYMRLHLSSPSGRRIDLLRIGGEGGLLDKSRLEGGIQGTPGFDTKYTQGEILLPPGGRADVVASIAGGPVGVPFESGLYTLWTEDFLQSATGYANLPTVPVMFFQAAPSDVTRVTGIGFKQALRPAFDQVEALPDTTDQPLNPALFHPDKPGNRSPQIGLSIDSSGFGIDGVHGSHEVDGDFMTAFHQASARYVSPGRTYTLSVANPLGTRHPFHLHGFSFQPVDLTKVGAATPSYTWDYHEFVDTIDVPPGMILRFKVRIDQRPLEGEAGFTGGEIGRWVMHCHIFSHAESGMISELVVTGSLVDGNERPQMTIDDFDVTGVRGQTATVSGSYADPDLDQVFFDTPRDAGTGEATGTVTKTGFDTGRWTWTLPINATEHDRQIKISQLDSNLNVNQLVFDLHVQDPPPVPSAPDTTTAGGTTTPSGSTGDTSARGSGDGATTPPAAADRTAPVISRVRAKRVRRGLQVQLRLSERASVSVGLIRRGRTAAAVVRKGVAGRNTVTLRKRLRPGRYSLVVRAVDAAGNGARPVKVSLRIGRR